MLTLLQALLHVGIAYILLVDARLRRESTIIEPPFVIGLRELLAIIIEGDGGGAKIRTPD